MCVCLCVYGVYVRPQSPLSKLLDLLGSGVYTLEAVMAEEDFLQEVAGRNPTLIRL